MHLSWVKQLFSALVFHFSHLCTTDIIKIVRLPDVLKIINLFQMLNFVPAVDNSPLVRYFHDIAVWIQS